MMTAKKLALNEHAIALMKGRVFVRQNELLDNSNAVHTLQANLMGYRYLLSEDAFVALSKNPESHIRELFASTINYLRDFMGENIYVPLYGNFPLSEKDRVVFWNALQHYWNRGNWGTPPVMEKPVAFEKVQYNVLNVVDEAGFDKIFTDIVSINQSLTPMDIQIVEWFVESGRKLIMPDVIPFKENLCKLAGMGVPGLPIKTPTDVLRIAVYLSGGDISLPAVPKANVPQKSGRWSRPVHKPDRSLFKFKKFSRAERRYLLSLLEAMNAQPEDMSSRSERWLRLGEILHPGEYSKRFPKTYNAFAALRNEKVRSWSSQFNTAIKKDLTAALQLLCQRPGEFVRKLDWLLRSNPNKTTDILYYFSTCAKGSSNKVLYELYTHFENRTHSTSGRSIMIKGARKRTPLPELPALDIKIINQVQATILEVLTSKFGKLSPLKKVYIDPELKKIPVPTNMRSMNLSLKPVVRGQRTPFENKEAKVMRAYVHWVDKAGTIDIDLSTTFVGKRVDVLSYMQTSIGKSCHSGDVIARRGNCAEYIDIDIEDAKLRGYQYVLMDVRNFRGGTLEEVECVCGYMEREFPESNKTWLPETVVGCQKLQSKSSVTLVAILDLETMEYIHLDIDSAGTTFARGDIKTITNSIKQYAELPKFSAYHLLEMHAIARGEVVDTAEDADTVFAFKEFSDDYVTTAQYMGV